MPGYLAVPHSPSHLLASIFTQETSTTRTLLVSGPSGAGKTHWCQQLVEAARLQHLTTAGLLSLPVFEQGLKTRIDLLDLHSGVQNPLALPAGSLASGPIVGPWQFEPSVLEWGNEIIRNIAPCQLLILDELGPLEFELQSGFTPAFDLIASRACHLTCVVVRPSFLSSAMQLWPWAEILFVPTRQEPA